MTNYTEDNTFRRLKQLPFDKLIPLVDIEVILNSSPDWKDILTQQLVVHGWTFDEYSAVFKQRQAAGLPVVPGQG